MTRLGYQFENLVFKVAVATSGTRIAPAILGHLNDMLHLLEPPTTNSCE